MAVQEDACAGHGSFGWQVDVGRIHGGGQLMLASNGRDRRWSPPGVPRLWLSAGATACALAVVICLASDLGPLSTHMSLHILAMNAFAPVVALAVLATKADADLARHRRGVVDGALGASLPVATAVQLAVLWLAHLPGILAPAMHGAVLHALLQALLFAVALWFWLAIFAQAGSARWRAIAALLITGKLVCLLGILLVLAPRVLFLPHGVADGSSPYVHDGNLADQQLAGLLMIIACPLTYVLAGVVIAAKWIGGLADERCGSAAMRRVP